MDRLAIAPGGDDTLFAQQREMLRQGRLRQADARLELADRQFPIGQLAQDHQPPLVAEQAEQTGGATGAILEQSEIEFGKIEHGRHYMH